LCAGSQLADDGAEVQGDLVGGLPGFGEVLDLDHAPGPKIQSEESVRSDLGFAGLSRRVHGG
jgi:hypothetical protein